MRADRLVAILLMLQRRGRITAAEVAAELEISERTARRDLDALGVAGLPVYSLQGRNGGWELVGGGSTDLSGLTAAEVEALFLVAGPAAASPPVKAALRKLVHALPESFRTRAESASRAVVVDQSAWGHASPHRPPPPHLELVQRAVVEGTQLVLGYVARDGAATRRVVHPLGLAAKRSVWYLVADTDAGLRTFRIDRVQSAQPTGEAVVRPLDFDLAEAWEMITTEVGRQRPGVRARALVVPEAVQLCRYVLGDRIQIGPSTADGRVETELRGHDLDALAGEIAGFGAMVEVLDPTDLRQRLARIGAELTASYGNLASRRRTARR